MNFIIVIVVLIGAVVAVSLIPLRFRIHYCKEGINDFISVTWQAIPGLWGITAEVPFIKISSKAVWPIIKTVTQIEGEKGLPLIEEEKSVALDWHKVKKVILHLPGVINKIGEFATLGKWILKRITVREFSWFTEIGTGEAAKTGILTGLLWSVKATAYGYLHSLVRKVLQRPKIKIIPNFHEQVAAWNVDCIFNISCGHIIIGGIKAIYIFKKKRW